MQLYHNVLLLSQCMRFVNDRWSNFIMMPCFVFSAFIYSLFQDRFISINLFLVIFFCRTMIYFTEWFLFGVQHLVILFDRNQSKEDGLSFLVEKSWVGHFANHWPRLKHNSILPKLSVEISLLWKKHMGFTLFYPYWALNFDRALS